MELIPYSEFGRLRLRDFCGDEVDESDRADWKWMGGQWYYDGIGFTWFGRLLEMSGETGGLEVDVSEVSEGVWSSIFASLQLPLRAGMTLGAITNIFGAPVESQTFVEDRKTYYFRVGLQNPYRISCTVHDVDGLMFVSVIREDVLSKIGSA